MCGRRPYPLNRKSSTLGILGWLLFFCLFVACQHEDPLPLLEEAHGWILPGEPVLLLPNRAWRQHQTRKDVWFFGQSASILCYVLEPPSEPLTFIFYPENPDRQTPIDFDWNGIDAGERIHTLKTGEIRVTIEPEWLRSGRNFLTLSARNAEASPEEINSFLRIGYQIGDQLAELPIERILRYRYLADLLQFSLTGSYGNEKMNGFVFVGSHTQTFRLANDSGGSFSTKVQNSTGGPGKVSLQAGETSVEVQLKAHQKQLLNLKVPPGVDRLTLTAKSQDEGFFLWGAPHFKTTDSVEQPPILFITLDTTRKDVLAAYGGDPNIAPHLNTFAETATIFENALTTAPWTLPSHASMFTGLYPSKHGAGVVNDHLEGQFTTLAEHLRDANYLTFGQVGGTLTSFRFGLGQGFGLYTNPYGLETRADRLTIDALRLLARYGIVSDPDPNSNGHGSMAKGDAPFFLFLNYFDPHYPFNAPRHFQARFDLLERLEQRPSGDPWAEIVRQPGPAWEEIVEGRLKPRPEDIELLRDAYHAEVAFMDEHIGRLFAALKEAGIYDRTMIIAVADHGELLGEKGFFSHSSRLDSELVEVPMIIKWPGQTQGRRVPDTVSVVDLFPTVLQAVSLPIPEQDGLPLAPKSLQDLGGREYVVMEEHDNDFHRLSPFMKLADQLYGFQTPVYRQLTWKEGDLCYTQEELVWRPQACPEATVSRAWRWRRWLENEAFQPTVQRIGLSNEERSKLKALGYL